MPQNSICSRPLQHVFQIDDVGIAAGFPSQAKDAYFLMTPDRDYRLANDFLYGIHLGIFDEHRFLDPPSWMSPGRGRCLSNRSKKAIAQALATGIEAITKRGVHILTFSNVDLKNLAGDLRRQGAESGIGFIQKVMLHYAQWCVWRGLRDPVKVQHATISVKLDQYDDFKPREIIKVGAIVSQPTKPAQYIDRKKVDAIAAEMRKQADGHWRAFETLAKTGLRSGEVGRVLDRQVPRAFEVVAAQPATFTVWGKGDKKRYPEMPPALVVDIDKYRAVERRTAVARALASGKKAPTALFLKKDGTAVTYASLRRAFKKACKKLGIHARLHWLRHTFAANYLADGAVAMWKAARNAGVTISLGELTKITEVRQFSLMALLGHSSMKTTAMYLDHVHRALMAQLMSVQPMETQPT